MSTIQLLTIHNIRLSSAHEIQSKLQLSTPHVNWATSAQRIASADTAMRSAITRVMTAAGRSVKRLPPGSIETLTRVVGVVEALAQQPNQVLREFVERAQSGSKSISMLRSASERISRGDCLTAKNAEDLLVPLATVTDLMRTTHKQMVSAEVEVINSKLSESLEVLGYTVEHSVTQTKHGGDRVILAERGTRTVGARISPMAEVEIDLAGFEGHSCSNEADRVIKELGNRGLEVAIRTQEYHGKKEGGQLLAAIAQSLNPLVPHSSRSSISRKKLIRLAKISQRTH